MSEPRVLIIEDNRDLALGLRVNFEDRGYAATLAHSASEGMRRARQADHDLILLDLSLPDMDGLDVIETLRADGRETPVIVLTARSQQASKIKGLRSGADDYVTKPFDVEELFARVEVVLRRRPSSVEVVRPIDPIRFGDIVLDPAARTVTRSGEPLQFSRIAFDLLLALASKPGQVVAREDLMREVWGYDKDVVSRTLDTHIFDLRRLIEPDPTHPRHIVTVWRIGYRFTP